MKGIYTGHDSNQTGAPGYHCSIKSDEMRKMNCYYVGDCLNSGELGMSFQFYNNFNLPLSTFRRCIMFGVHQHNETWWSISNELPNNRMHFSVKQLKPTYWHQYLILSQFSHSSNCVDLLLKSTTQFLLIPSIFLSLTKANGVSNNALIRSLVHLWERLFLKILNFPDGKIFYQLLLEQVSNQFKS